MPTKPAETVKTSRDVFNDSSAWDDTPEDAAAQEDWDNDAFGFGGVSANKEGLEPRKNETPSKSSFSAPSASHIAPSHQSIDWNQEEDAWNDDQGFGEEGEDEEGTEAFSSFSDSKVPVTSSFAPQSDPQDDYYQSDDGFSQEVPPFDDKKSSSSHSLHSHHHTTSSQHTAAVPIPTQDWDWNDDVAAHPPNTEKILSFSPPADPGPQTSKLLFDPIDTPQFDDEPTTFNPSFGDDKAGDEPSNEVDASDFNDDGWDSIPAHTPDHHIQEESPAPIPSEPLVAPVEEDSSEPSLFPPIDHDATPSSPPSTTEPSLFSPITPAYSQENLFDDEVPEGEESSSAPSLLKSPSMPSTTRPAVEDASTDIIPEGEASEVSPIVSNKNDSSPFASPPRRSPSTSSNPAIAAVRPSSPLQRPSSPSRSLGVSSESFTSRESTTAAPSTITTSTPSTPHQGSKSEAKEAMKRLASVQTKLKEQSKLIDSLNHEKQRLLSELQREKELSETYQKKKNEAEKAKNELEKKFASLEKEKLLIEKEKDAAQRSIESAQKEKVSTHQSDQQNHEAVVAHLTDQINRYAAMADEVKQRAEAKREKLLEVLEERKKTIEKLKRENEDNLASLRRDHQLVLDQLKEGGLKNVNALERKIQSMEEARKEVEKEKENVSHIAALHETQIATLQKEKEALQAQLVHSKRGEEEEAKEAWKWKEEFQKSFEASQALLQARIDELQAQRDSIATENATLQEHVAKVVGKREKERRDLEDSLSSLKDSLSSSQANEAHLHSLIEQKEELISSVEQAVEEERENLISYRAKASSHLAILTSNLLTYQQVLSQHSIPDPITTDPENSNSLQNSLSWISTESSSSNIDNEPHHARSSKEDRTGGGSGAFSSTPILSTLSLSAINHHLSELVHLIDTGAFSSLLTPIVQSDSSRSSSGNGAPSNAPISFGEISNIKQLASQILGVTLKAHEEAEEGHEESHKVGPSISLSPSSLLSIVSSLSNLLLSSASKLSQLRLELDDAKAHQHSLDSLKSSQSGQTESSLSVSLSMALKDKESEVTSLEKELEDAKNELSDIRSSQATASETLRREEEAREKEKKDMEARREEREAAREEELKKLKRALAARAASAASLPELQAKINALNDQLIAKQTQVDALEADRRSYEDWASGVPGTASKPLRRASRIPPSLSGASTMEDDEVGRSDDFSDLPLPATSDPSSSSSLAIELPGDVGESMSGGAPATLQSILTGRGFSDAKSRILTRARTVGREMDRKLEKQEWAKRVASYLPSTLRARLLLILYLCFLQVLVIYFMTSSSSCSEVTGAKKDPLLE